MATIETHENPMGQSAVITVDRAVVGWITLTGPKTYTVDTGGRVPAIDGITGVSPKDAHDNIVAKVRAGGVVLVTPVSNP